MSALSVSTIFQSDDQNILKDAVITSDAAPVATYDLQILNYRRPDWRIKWNVNTLTITWTLVEPLQGDVLVIPISNLQGSGSPGGGVTLTNGDGLSESIAMPPVGANGFPETLAVDLTIGTPTDATRTSDLWNLEITGNPTNITIGGAIMIYGPKTQLVDRDFRWGYTRRREGAQSEIQNEYLTRYSQNLMAFRRGLDLETLCTEADGDRIQAWFDGGNGRALPGLLWVVDLEQPLFGVWQQVFERVRRSAGVVDTDLIRMSFDELSKGIPIL